jgi:hypothetical protein
MHARKSLNVGRSLSHDQSTGLSEYAPAKGTQRLEGMNTRFKIASVIDQHS